MRVAATEAMDSLTESTYYPGNNKAFINCMLNTICISILSLLHFFLMLYFALLLLLAGAAGSLLEKETTIGRWECGAMGFDPFVAR